MSPEYTAALTQVAQELGLNHVTAWRYCQRLQIGSEGREKRLTPDEVETLATYAIEHRARRNKEGEE